MMSTDTQTPEVNRSEPRKIHSVNLDRQICLVRYSPCGRYLAAGGYDASVRRWQVAENGLTSMSALSGHNGWVQSLAFHPDRRRLFTADSWGEVRCWAYAEREPQPLVTIAEAHDGWVRDMAVSANGQFLATCGMDQKVCVWTSVGRKVRELTGHNDDVFSVGFHPNNRSLVSGDMHGKVFQWDINTGRKTREFDCGVLYTLSRLQDVGGVRRIVFDQAGRTLACAGTTPRSGGNVQGTPTILLFDWESGRLQHTLRAGGNGDGFVYDLAFHSTGFVMAVSSGNPGTGKFYFHTPGEERPFFLHTRMPNCHSLAVHPNGNRMVVAATNSGSNGNGRRLRDGEYRGNYSPLHVWEIASS